jgi:hypothetical protein
MKLNSDETCGRTRKLLVIAQLMSLAFFALGLAFAYNPTPIILFLFTTLSPVLALAAVFILVTQWIATYRRQQMHEVVGWRGTRTNTRMFQSSWLDGPIRSTPRMLSRGCAKTARPK